MSHIPYNFSHNGLVTLKIVLNPTTYPNFLSFLRHKNVPTAPTEMTFSVSRDAGRFEWAGKNPFTVFCQPKRLLDWRIWILIYDALRFNACAGRILKSNDFELSIGEYLRRNNYSQSFMENYLIVSPHPFLSILLTPFVMQPMTAAIWSTPPGKCALDFPARTLVFHVSVSWLQ